MFRPRFGLLAVLTASASVANGQATWVEGQVNTTICQWQQLRAHVVRDTVYMDGGNLWWLPGLSDGSYGKVDNDHNKLGLVYTLNFSRPFSTTGNMTAIFGTVSKVSSGTAAKNLAPNYVDGAMLGNNAEWFLYGGMLRQTNEFSDPAATNVLAYQRYQYGVQKDGFLPGFVYDDLPQDMTRYLAYGGAAAAPSENKAWYFSGMHAPGFGPIYEPGFNASLTAVNVSNTLITLDMTTQLQESWKNETLPSEIPGRANPELVWVPVGKQGILVALGGVVYPEFISVSRKSADEATSKQVSPGFMSTIDIYDVASGKWYRQPTTGGPGQLTRGCAVVASARDHSSHNIYWYGGYPGLSATADYSDDVWVLSIPSFTWTKVAEGKSAGRAGHKCFMPYPDQMFVIGGYPASPGGSLTCLRETVRVFNVSSGVWLPNYDPSKWSEYTIPDAIVAKIGGSPTGGATATTPSPSFSATALAAIFAEKYPTSKIVTYYPYQSQASTNNTNPTVPTGSDTPSSGGGVPSYLAPVLGVVLGLMFLTMIAVLVLLWRRRRLFRARGGMSEAGTEDTNGHRIMSWMRGQTASEAKAPTVTSDETPSSPDDIESIAPHPLSMAEMMNTEIRAPVELMDTSPRSELHDTGLSHVDIMSRYSRLGDAITNSNTSSSLNHSSSFATSGTHQIDHAASPCSPSVSHGLSQTRHMSAELPAHDNNGDTITPLNSPKPASAVAAVPVSPEQGKGQDRVRGYIPSGVSGISERDRAHLRTISADTTVSSVASVPGDSAEEGVMSPPTGVGEGGEGDYISSGSGSGSGNVGGVGSGVVHRRSGSGTGSGANVSPTNPLRRSVFHESREDMTDMSPGGQGKKSGI